MKNVMLLLSAAVLLLAAGCTGSEGGEQEEPDLEALYAAGEEACGWTAEEMTTVEGELMDAYYPGLNELDVKQLVAKVPAMSSVVNEIVLVRCGTEEDAEKAVEILQARIDAQVQGDAGGLEESLRLTGGDLRGFDRLRGPSGRLGKPYTKRTLIVSDKSQGLDDCGSMLRGAVFLWTF